MKFGLHAIHNSISLIQATKHINQSISSTNPIFPNGLPDSLLTLETYDFLNQINLDKRWAKNEHFINMMKKDTEKNGF